MFFFKEGKGVERERGVEVFERVLTFFLSLGRSKKKTVMRSLAVRGAARMRWHCLRARPSFFAAPTAVPLRVAAAPAALPHRWAMHHRQASMTAAASSST